MNAPRHARHEYVTPPGAALPRRDLTAGRAVGSYDRFRDSLSGPDRLPAWGGWFDIRNDVPDGSSETPTVPMILNRPVVTDRCTDADRMRTDRPS